MNIPIPRYAIYRDIPYCEECPFLKVKDIHSSDCTFIEGYCDFLKEELSFYDWFIAECVMRKED